jgi:hypothetical protein
MLHFAAFVEKSSQGSAMLVNGTKESNRKLPSHTIPNSSSGHRTILDKVIDEDNLLPK